ncbi:disease resistance protein RGA5-like isoform X2 [Phragmites australis]|uniref:disease resistance protein RGA5-like isoform X2 n=1 Tax=Phragmites australis TaxID=29695 RepID=UPI002D788E6E|nr:disease resistance protein RGA5-like isoform X2 [Phragmites australis]
MAGFVVSASMGVMNPLLAKLTTLMGDEYKKLKRVRKEVSFLKDELSTMKALLERMDDADELDSLAKDWRKHVIAMTYDIEDCVDDFMHCVGEADGKVGVLQKASSYLRTYKDHYRIANQIQEIKTRVVQASERRLRYFIVVDDLWDVRAWNIISCAFPRNNEHSRVLVTTRIEDVARACCSDHLCIHTMKPLSDPDSRKLFFNRIFGSEDACPSQLLNVSSEILKKCGGLPLAIITVASILACQPTRIKEQWEYIKNSLAAHSAINPTLEDMMYILDLSYKNLPQHLKACFLYIGLYPEDREIRRDELVRAWVAEGIVSCPPWQDKWDVAKSCFNDLINRSMIQPVYDKYTNEVVHCRVHDMMLDLIVRRCREDNFIIVVRDLHALTELQDKVRRLSVDLSGAEDDTTVSVTTISCLSQVRSLAIYGASKWMPPLSDFKFLRVLFLEFPKRPARIDLTGIIHLPHLRYLNVECKAAWSEDGLELRIVLPSQIRRLQYLETLELPFSSVCTIPSDIFDLPCLSHLVVPAGTRFPDRIGKVKSLRTLVCYSLHKDSAENTRALGELTNLAELRLNCGKVYWETMLRCTDDDDDTPEATWGAALSSSLQKLGNLKQLSIFSPIRTCNGDALSSSFSPPFCNLEDLHLSGWTFSRVPRWIGHLQNLRELSLGLKLKETTTCWEEVVGIIGRLPSLVVLSLRILGVLTERIVISGFTGFSVLKWFDFDCDGISFLTFEAGAMPNLQLLQLEFDPQEWDKATPAGLQHLSKLKEIRLMAVRHHNTTIRDEMSAGELIKGIFQKAAGALPSCAVFNTGSAVRPIEWDS